MQLKWLCGLGCATNAVEYGQQQLPVSDERTSSATFLIDSGDGDSENQMPLLRLTAKFLAEVDPQPPPDSASTPSLIGDWYGHIFTVERRKCVIFINEPTLFVCPALSVRKSEYRAIIPFFLGVLTQAFRTMGFSEKEIDWVLAMHKDIAIGRATNRSPLGSLNNRITDIRTLFAWHLGFENCDIGSVTKLLNETPMKPIGYSNGLAKMRSLVEMGMK